MARSFFPRRFQPSATHTRRRRTKNYLKTVSNFSSAEVPPTGRWWSVTSFGRIVCFPSVSLCSRRIAADCVDARGFAEIIRSRTRKRIVVKSFRLSSKRFVIAVVRANYFVSTRRNLEFRLPSVYSRDARAFFIVSLKVPRACCFFVHELVVTIPVVRPPSKRRLDAIKFFTADRHRNANVQTKTGRRPT